VKHGVPWDVAINLDATERFAYNVILGEAESGQAFDWSTLSWRDR